MKLFKTLSIGLLLAFIVAPNTTFAQKQDDNLKKTQKTATKLDPQNTKLDKKTLERIKQRKEAEKAKTEKDKRITPDWAKSANIYEVNVRQYTPEGTFAAFGEHLPRLKEMGVDIIWLMPIHPISKKKRKGSLGSYYAVADYKGINPEFGNEKDLRKLIKQVHQADMKIIIDWVANHTGWDNAMIKEHKDWYTKDKKGKMQPPVEDWSDVADLDFEKKELQKYMIDAMSYWVKEFAIDGFRCDVAGMVPTEFWNNARQSLDKIKPVFMLAEAEEPALHQRAFDMSYAWEFHHLMNAIAKGEKSTRDLDDYFLRASKDYDKNDYRMNFTTNHDENSWNGTTAERMGDAHKAFAVLSFTAPGMPLIYSGQETGLDKRLRFFDKDTIEWKQDHEMMKFYTQLLRLKRINPALWNGEHGGNMARIKTGNPNVYAFVRKKDVEGRTNHVMVVLNLSKEKQSINMPSAKRFGQGFYNGLTLDKKVIRTDAMTLEPWGYQVLIK